MSNDSEYILSSPVEKERLQLQARLWEPKVEALLERLGVQPGWHCLDVGCGAMGILGPLSRRVGPTGRVVGIDIDPKLLAAARAYIADENLTNVEIYAKDARNTDLPRESFDLVHTRFMLVFGHAPEILQEMFTLTRPGGLIVAQETDQSAWNFYPANDVWPRLKAVLEEAFLHIGGNANLGPLLLPLMRNLGLVDLQFQVSSLALTGPHPYMQMPLIGAQGFRPVILQNNLLSEQELNELLTAYEQMITRPETYATWFNVNQVWGRKPLSGSGHE